MKPPRDISFEYTGDEIRELVDSGLDPNKVHDAIERLVNIPNKLVRNAISEKLTYDRYESATNIIREVRSAIKNKVEVKEVYLDYLAHCFNKIIDHDIDPKIAFNLIKPNHAPTKKGLKHLRFEIFSFYSIKKLKDEGMAVNKAIDFIAKKECISFKLMEKIYYQTRRRAQGSEDNL